MADLQPSSSESGPESDPDDGAPRVVELDSEDGEALLEALSSETARTVLAALHEGPATPSAVADAADTSLQNVHYHLDNLQDAGAVEVVDTETSEKGREMNVYAPVDGSLVVLTGQRDERSGIRAALGRILGGVAVVAAGSLAVQALFGDGLLPGGGSTAPATTTGGPTIADVTGAPPGGGAGGAGAGVPPGVLFFAGGVTVLLVWVLAWYVETRPSD